MQIPEMIYKIREVKEMTLQEVADMTGYSKGRVSQFETGKGRISEKFMAAFRSKLKVNPDWWETQTGPMFSTDRNTICDNVVDLGPVPEVLLMQVRGNLAGLPDPIERERKAMDYLHGPEYKRQLEEKEKEIFQLKEQLAEYRRTQEEIIKPEMIKLADENENLSIGERLAEEQKGQRTAEKKTVKNERTTPQEMV